MDTKLKKAREKRGFTQAEVAKKAKVSVMSYQRYEAGKREPTVTTAKLIAKVLNSRIEELF